MDCNASIAIVCIILAFGSVDSDSDTKDVQSQSAAYTLSANDLIQAYIKNEVTADSKYNGKVVAISGRIEGIGKGILGEACITIGNVPSKDFFDRSVQCSFTESELGSFGGLSKGMQVTIKGRVECLLIDLQVNECRITDIPK